MRRSMRPVVFTLALMLVAAASSDARWQGPLIAVGIGPYGPIVPYSYPPHSQVLSPSPPVLQFPPSPPQRPKSPPRLPTAAIPIPH